MPTRLRAGGMPVDDVAALTALLTLPWALKFVWAPAVDRFRSKRWGYRAWITVAQVAMGLTLLPLAMMPLQQTLGFVAVLLLAHAFAAATQDVAIDALAISTVREDDRGRTTGWMQAGMLIGRGAFGGLALAAERWIGPQAVVAVLIACVLSTLVTVWTSNAGAAGELGPADRPPRVLAPLSAMLRRRATWIGLGVALTAGAGFESVGGLMGPFLLDRGADKELVGWFFALPVIFCMIVGGLVGGWVSDRYGHRRAVAGSVAAIVACIGGLVSVDLVFGGSAVALMAAAVPIYFLLGALTASSYAFFMDLTDVHVGGTQFSAFMGATNLCEVWSIALAGFVAAKSGYSVAFLALGAASLVSIVLLRRLRVGEAARQSSAS